MAQDAPQFEIGDGRIRIVPDTSELDRVREDIDTWLEELPAKVKAAFAMGDALTEIEQRLDGIMEKFERIDEKAGDVSGGFAAPDEGSEEDRKRDGFVQPDETISRDEAMAIMEGQELQRSVDDINDKLEDIRDVLEAKDA